MLKTMDVSFFHKNVAKNMVKKFLNHVKESGTNAFNTPLKSVIQKTVETACYFVGNQTVDKTMCNQTANKL